MIRVAIMDPEGRLLGPDQVGEIVVRGPSVMKHYYKNPAATAETTRFGWHHTGDAGYFDGEGFFYIVDRMVDLIPSDDGPISPSAIERAILAHEAVRDCVVVGSADAGGGVTKIVAVAELKAGATATVAEAARGVPRAPGASHDAQHARTLAGTAAQRARKSTEENYSRALRIQFVI